MNTNQVYSYLHVLFKNSNVCFDVIPSDYLSNYVTNQLPLFLVVNNCRSHNSGQHWLAIVKKSIKHPVEFFCSYGKSIDDYNSDFVQFIARLPKNMNRRLLYRPIRLQSYGSSVCAQYCIFYIARRYKNCSRNAFYSTFNENTTKNDKVVADFVNLKNPLLHGPLCKANKTHVQCCKKFTK